MAVHPRKRFGARRKGLVRSSRFVALVLALGLVLAACGDDGADDGDGAGDDGAADDGAADDGDGDDGDAAGGALEPSEGDVEIDIWFGRDDFQPDDQFESFMEEYPNITVNADTIPLEQATADFLRQFESGDAPDVVQLEAAQVGLLSRRDMVMDIQPILDTWQEENAELYDNMAPIAWDMASWEGTPHGLALHHGPYWHVYRSDVAEEVGAEEPETWDEMLEFSRQVVDQTDMWGYATMAGSSELPNWAVGVYGQMGGEYEDAVMQIDSEPGHAWLEFWQTVMRDELAHPDSIAWLSGDSRAAFIGGQAAQITEGMNLFPEFNRNLDYGEEWDVRPEPLTLEGHEDNARHLSFGWPYYVSAATEHPYEVGLVLQYLADFDQSLSVALRYQPVANLEAMGSDEYVAANPWAEKLMPVLEVLEPRPAHVNDIAMADVIQQAQQWAMQNPDAADEIPERAAEWQEQLNQLADEVPPAPDE